MIRVLMVDDEPSILDVSKIFLEKTGEFEVDTVESAEEALKKLASARYEAVVSDYRIPGMDGIEFLKEVRALDPAFPFILFTGKGREEVVIEALDNGIDYYIRKGTDTESQFAELSYKIRLAVEQRRAQKEILEQHKQLSIINEIIRVANSSLILDEMLEMVLKITLNLLDCEMGWIYLKSPDGRTASMKAHYGVPQSFIEEKSTVFIRDWPYNLVFCACQPRYVEPMPEGSPGSLDTRIMEEVSASSFAGIPLISDSVVVGALYIGQRTGHEFSEREKTVLESIGREIGGTILRGMLQEQLEEAYLEEQCYFDLLEQHLKSLERSMMEHTGIVTELIHGTGRHYAEKLNEDIHEVIGITNDISTIRRLADSPDEFDEVELDSILASMRERFPHTAISVHETGMTVLADDLLAELFANLIRNRTLSRKGDLQISIGMEEGEDGMLRVSVEDSGPGVPDEDKPGLFVCPRSVSQNGGKSNLGLIIARMLVERYCGRIWAEDRIAGRPDEGLAIRFTLVPALDD
ncbi:MAG: response regulator [Methanomicrobiaceae archaeon]|nr:response regulator [Methanomicrobiaceae archaeon]